MSNKMALDALTEFDEALTTWANAYPESVFPVPDLAKAAKLLEAGGMTLDAISADAMRHIAKTMHADFADCRAAIAALQAEPQPEPVAQIVGTGGTANMPLLQWLSADHSFRAPIGSMLYALPATPPKD